MLWPLEDPVITQYFGEHYIDYSRWGYPGHNGLDLWTPVKPALVCAIAGGAVLQTAWEQDGYGKYVVVQHPGGWRSYYAHLASVYLRPGEPIGEGTPIGRMGASGNATGPHLHLGVRLGGGASPEYRGYIDPLPVLRGEKDPADCNPKVIDGSWQEATAANTPGTQTGQPTGAVPAEAGQPAATSLTARPLGGYQLPGSVIVKISRNKTVYRMRRYY